MNNPQMPLDYENSKPKPALMVMYYFVMPGITFVGLCIVASINGHRVLVFNAALDFIIRIVITIYFCFMYTSLIKKPKYDPNFFYDTKNDSIMRFFVSMGGTIGNLLGTGLATFWIMEAFFLFDSGVNIFIAMINALIVAIPVTNQLAGTDKV